MLMPLVEWRHRLAAIVDGHTGYAAGWLVTADRFSFIIGYRHQYHTSHIIITFNNHTLY